MRIRALSLPLLFSLAAACGGSAQPSDVPAPSASAPVEAPAASSPAPAASASAAPAADAEPAEPKGPFHFKDYAGPKVKASIDTKKVWGIQPVGRKDEWDLLKFMLEDFGRIEGDEVVIKHFDGAEIFVPGALVFPAKPAKGLKKGDVVMADVAAASAHGRVVSVEKDGDDTRVLVKYLWGGSLSEDHLSADQVLKTEDKIGYGNRVAWKQDGEWKLGTFAGGDKETAFVLDASDRPALVKLKDLKAAKITPVRKKGDKVWVSDFGSLKPAVITEVLEGGVGYKVKTDKGEDTSAHPLDDVTSPVE